MSKYKQIFSQGKTIIGMIHLPPLPGTPEGKDARFTDLCKFALSELEKLQSGGVDGVIIENFWNMPYFPNEVPSITIASMAAIAGRVIEQSSIPVGVNILYNDFLGEISIARAMDAAFIRAEVFVDPSLSETGIIQPSAASLYRERHFLNADGIGIFADIHSKNTTPIWDRSLLESALDAQNRAKADAIIITGAGTGKPVVVEDLQNLREKLTIPLLIGSGVTAQTITELIKNCDGAIVGSYFKTSGNINLPTDINRVRELVEAVKNSRAS